MSLFKTRREAELQTENQLQRQRIAELETTTQALNAQIVEMRQTELTTARSIQELRELIYAQKTDLLKASEAEAANIIRNGEQAQALFSQTNGLQQKLLEAFEEIRRENETELTNIRRSSEATQALLKQSQTLQQGLLDAFEGIRREHAAELEYVNRVFNDTQALIAQTNDMQQQTTTILDEARHDGMAELTGIRRGTEDVHAALIQAQEISNEIRNDDSERRALLNRMYAMQQRINELSETAAALEEQNRTLREHPPEDERLKARCRELEAQTEILKTENEALKADLLALMRLRPAQSGVGSEMQPIEYSARGALSASELRYAVVDGTITITGCALEPVPERIVIPEEIGGLPVIAIGENAFNGSAVRSIILPDGIIDIDDRAFARSQLEYIRLPDGLRRLGEGAFYCCFRLHSAALPNRIKSIGAYAFAGCPIRHIELPDGLERIDEGCFERSGLEDVRLPAALAVLQQGTFSGCENLSRAVLNVRLAAIREAAFWDTAVSELIIPRSVRYVESRMFEYSEAQLQAGTKLTIVIPGMNTAFVRDCYNAREYVRRLDMDCVIYCPPDSAADRQFTEYRDNIRPLGEWLAAQRGDISPSYTDTSMDTDGSEAI